jgi:hypothetical protein
MMKNKTKNSDLPCHTIDPRGGGEGGELDENTQKFNLNSHLFTPPLFEIEHCLTAGQASFVGLFIGHFLYQLT